MSMDVAVFDIHGPFGHYRKPYSLVSPVTFPVPPPTAVLGKVGAILGYAKNEYLEILNTGELRIGIQLLQPVKKFRATLNALRTKGSNKYFEPLPDNPRTQLSYEFLKDPGYRIFFGHSRRDIVDSLSEQLRLGRTAFTPCLGLAQCIGSVSYVGYHCAEAMTVAEEEFTEVDSILPVTDALEVDYETGRRFQRIRLPARMEPDRTVTRYQEVILAEDTFPILCKEADVFKVGGSRVSFL